MNFASKIFTITGGTSGIGAATARLLAQRGAAAVCVADVSSKQLPELKASLAAVNPHVQLRFAQVDVTSSASVDKWMRDVVEEFGNVHGSANVAGRPQAINMRKAPAILEETDDEWNQVINVNLTGVFHCTRAQVQVMKNLPPANRAIVNVASIAAVQHISDIYAYHVSKTGVAKFSASVAKDTQPFGVRVNSVMPGATRTPMLEKFIPSTKSEEEFQQAWQDLGLAIVQPEDIARTIVWLLSEDSCPVYGASINVGAALS